MQQYDVRGRPAKILFDLEVLMSHRRFNRAGVLGLGEHERSFDGPQGCLASFFMSISNRVGVSAVELDSRYTRILVQGLPGNERIFDEVLTEELGAKRVE